MRVSNREVMNVNPLEDAQSYQHSKECKHVAILIVFGGVVQLKVKLVGHLRKVEAGQNLGMVMHLKQQHRQNACNVGVSRWWESSDSKSVMLVPLTRTNNTTHTDLEIVKEMNTCLKGRIITLAWDRKVRDESFQRVHPVTLHIEDLIGIQSGIVL